MRVWTLTHEGLVVKAQSDDQKLFKYNKSPLNSLKKKKKKTNKKIIKSNHN